MITTLNQHDTHTVRIHLTRKKRPHYAALRCQQCNKHIQWLNQKQTVLIQKLLDEEKKNANQ